LPLIAQPAIPRVVAIGLDEALREELRVALGAAEITALEPRVDVGEEIERRDPDLVFVAVGAGGGGLGAVRELKLLPETHFFPLLAIGVEGGDTSRLPSLGAGADHWLGLPLPGDELRLRAQALMRTATFARAIRQSRRELRLRRDWVRYLVHDLRNALTKAIGDVAVAARKVAGENPAAQGLLLRCEEELWRSSALLEDLLDVDRIRKGLLQVRRAPTDLAALAGRVAESFREASRRAEVDIAVAASPEAVTVALDGAIVERVIANLVSNALRFAPAGTAITVSVTLADGRVAFEVENRGPSILPEKVSEIFEPFVKADDGPRGAGAGLGLAFCRLAVDLHGGTIAVTEPDGGGARFRVELPVGVSTS
jgi:signal transduction histidine kinase